METVADLHGARAARVAVRIKTYRLGADEKWSSFLDLFSFSIRMCGGELASTRLEARGKLDSALPKEGLDDAGLAR
jgi:hypothetical protein